MVNTSPPPLLRLSPSSLKNLSESSILRSFDLIIHAHSVYLYFLESVPSSSSSPRLIVSNSTIRLLIRFIIQVNILSPKSPISAFASIDLSVKRAALVLFGSFLLGFIPHLFFSIPSAGEPTQGYLHGGLLIDFIGQRNSREKGRVNDRRACESIPDIVGGYSDIITAIDNVGYYCDDDAKDF
jgi:hypothetical protein